MIEHNLLNILILDIRNIFVLSLVERTICPFVFQIGHLFDFRRVTDSMVDLDIHNSRIPSSRSFQLGFRKEPVCAVLFPYFTKIVCVWSGGIWVPLSIGHAIFT